MDMNRSDDGGFRRRFSPVRVGDELDVKIEATGKKGDGIATKQGFVLFVPNTKEGDNVRIKVTRVLNKVGFAEVIGQAQGQPESDKQPAEKFSEDEGSPEEQSEDYNEEPEDSEDFGEEEKQ